MRESVSRAAWGVLLPGFVGPELPAWLEEPLRHGLGGVCLFASNAADPVRLRALTAAVRALRPEAVIAVDEEGGDVTRLHAREGSSEPGNAVLGRLGDEAATAASARRIGEELAAAGIDLDLAPVVDANSNPDNPVIGARSFGDDPALVARHGAAWIRGLQSTGVAGCAKHFPGHGDTAVDSHLGLPVVDRDLEALRRRELLPFEAAIAAGVASIMTSHILLPALDPDAPATLSRRILTGLLREELGFEGVIVTDALDMAGASGGIGIPAAAVRALAAGADLLCLGSDSERDLVAVHAAIVRSVEDGELPAERLHDAATRVRALHAGSPRIGPDTPPPSPTRGKAALRASGPSAGLPQIGPDTPLASPIRGNAALREAPLAPEEVAAAFDVQPAAAALLAQPGPWTVVRLDVEANIAVGDSAWGPRDLQPDVVLDVSGTVDAPDVPGRVLVIGRDVHRHPHARAVVDSLRDRGAVVVVDMGWPSPDRRYADVATFGASRAVGEALLQLLEHREVPAWRS